MQIQYLTSCVAAFLLAALAPVFVVAGLSLSVQQSLVVSVQLSLIAFLISLGHAIFLGLPLFLIFQSKRWVNAISSVAGGFIVGIIPGGLLAGLLQSGGRLPALVNRVTVVEGMPTTAGWISYIEFVVLLGSFGALAGFVFWLVLKLSGGLAITAQAAEHGSPRRSHAGFRIGFAVIAMLLMGAVVAAPSIVKDRSCHNMFRDDRTTIGVKVRVGLLIGVDDWSKLKMVVEEFSAKRELSFRDSRLQRPDIALSLCNDRGTNIKVKGGDIFIYEVRVGSGWEIIARDLITDLESIWPGRVQFRDANNRVIPTPKELRGAGLNSPGG